MNINYVYETTWERNVPKYGLKKGKLLPKKWRDLRIRGTNKYTQTKLRLTNNEVPFSHCVYINLFSSDWKRPLWVSKSVKFVSVVFICASHQESSSTFRLEFPLFIPIFQLYVWNRGRQKVYICSVDTADYNFFRTPFGIIEWWAWSFQAPKCYCECRVPHKVKLSFKSAVTEQKILHHAFHSRQ